MVRLAIATLIVGFTAIATVLTAGVAEVKAAEQTVNARVLTQAFVRTVFGLEYGAGHPDAYRVKRYTAPVRFFVADRSGLSRAPAARAFLNALPRQIAHFKSSVVPTPYAANFHIFLVRERDFADVVARELRADVRAMNARCLVGVTTEEGRIVSSTAVIVADDDAVFSRCLVEEVLQGLGPMNDHDSLVHSVFNDTSEHTGFTAFDRALMNLLYHPAVRPGMTGAEVHQVLPVALRDLSPPR